MRKPLLTLAAVACLSGALWAAGATLDQSLQSAVGLPPRQACQALARLRDEAVAENAVDRYDAAMREALSRYQADREATLADPLARMRAFRLQTPPGLPQDVRVKAPWPGGTMSPDGNLDLVRPSPAVLQLRLRDDTVLTALKPVGPAWQEFPDRFNDHPLTFGSCAWAPDGLRLAYSVNGIICASTIDGQGQVAFHPSDKTLEGTWDDAPVWSPGGRALLCTRYDRDRLGHRLQPRVVWSDFHTEKVLGSGQALGFVPVVGKPDQVLMLGGESVYLAEPGGDDNLRRIASGATTAAVSPDGARAAVALAGRLGIVPLPQGVETAIPLPNGDNGRPMEVAQPPFWLSPVSIAVTLRQPAGRDHRYQVWLCDVRKGEFKKLTDGYMQVWNHNAREIATSAGLLELTY